MYTDNVFLTIASVSLIIFISTYIIIAYNLIKTLKAIRNIFESIEEKAQNLSVLKESFKVAVITFLSKILGDGKKH